MTSKEKVVEKLKKLKRHAESAEKMGSEEEAQAFASMLHKLLAKHNLEMSDLQWEEEKKTPHQAVWYTGKQRLASWIIDLAGTIATTNYCRVLMGGNGFRMMFIGTKASAETCVQTISYMHPVAEKISLREYDKKYNELFAAGKDTRSMQVYRASFLLGLVTRLRERYKEQEENILAELRRVSEVAGSTALVRRSDSLRLADEFIDAQPDITKCIRKQRSMLNFDGYLDGVKKANELRMSNDTSGQLTGECPCN